MEGSPAIRIEGLVLIPFDTGNFHSSIMQSATGPAVTGGGQKRLRKLLVGVILSPKENKLIGCYISACARSSICIGLLSFEADMPRLNASNADVHGSKFSLDNRLILGGFPDSSDVLRLDIQDSTTQFISFHFLFHFKVPSHSFCISFGLLRKPPTQVV